MLGFAVTTFAIKGMLTSTTVVIGTVVTFAYFMWTESVFAESVMFTIYVGILV